MALRSVGGNVVLSDYRAMITTMRQVQPELVRALRKKYRQIAMPLVKDVKSAIPATPPLSGMLTKVGRLSWSRTMNQNRPIRSVLIKEKRSMGVRAKGMPIVGLVQARVMAGPVALADMAGRSGAYVNARSVTREYDYTGPMAGKPAGVLGKRKHRINGQGRIMIARLNAKASRFVYPAAERSLPEVSVNIRNAMDDAANKLNQMLRSN